MAFGADKAELALRDSLNHLLEVMFSNESVDENEALAAFLNLARPDADLSAAAESLTAGIFDSELNAGIRAAFKTWFSARCTPSAEVSVVDATQCAYVLAQGIGLLIAKGRPGAQTADLREQVVVLIEALANPTSPSELPSLDIGFFRLQPAGPEGAAHDPVLAEFLREVADVGFEKTTIASVARRAKKTQKSIKGRYGDKASVFAAANKWRNAHAYRVHFELFAGLGEQLGAGRADAIAWREYMRPDNAPGRALAIEQVRVAWREPAFRSEYNLIENNLVREMSQANPALSKTSIRGRLHWELASGLGAELLPFYLPEIWSLPFDVVTVPLLGGGGRIGYLAPWQAGKEQP